MRKTDKGAIFKERELSFQGGKLSADFGRKGVRAGYDSPPYLAVKIGSAGMRFGAT